MTSVPTFSKVGYTAWQNHKNCNENVQLCNLRSLKIGIFQKRVKSEFRKLVIRAVATKPELDFSDPDWKKKIQEDFERRYNLPHIRDVIHVEPRPTTFSLKGRYFFPLRKFHVMKKHKYSKAYPK